MQHLEYFLGIGKYFEQYNNKKLVLNIFRFPKYLLRSIKSAELLNLKIKLEAESKQKAAFCWFLFVLMGKPLDVPANRNENDILHLDFMTDRKGQLQHRRIMGTHYVDWISVYTSHCVWTVDCKLHFHLSEYSGYSTRATKAEINLTMSLL